MKCKNVNECEKEHVDGLVEEVEKERKKGESREHHRTPTFARIRRSRMNGCA